MATTTDYWRVVSDLIKTTKCCFRVKRSPDREPTRWEGSFFIIPTNEYIETGALGPVPMWEVDWVEIDSIEVQHVGRLVAPRLIDHTAELIEHLDRHGALFQIIEHGVKVLPPAT